MKESEIILGAKVDIPLGLDFRYALSTLRANPKKLKSKPERVAKTGLVVRKITGEFIHLEQSNYMGSMYYVTTISELKRVGVVKETPAGFTLIKEYPGFKGDLGLTAVPARIKDTYAFKNSKGIISTYERSYFSPEFWKEDCPFKVGVWVVTSGYANGWGSDKEVCNRVLQITSIDGGRYLNFGSLRTSKEEVRLATAAEIAVATEVTFSEGEIVCILDTPNVRAYNAKAIGEFTRLIPYITGSSLRDFNKGYEMATKDNKFRINYKKTDVRKVSKAEAAVFERAEVAPKTRTLVVGSKNAPLVIGKTISINNRQGGIISSESLVKVIDYLQKEHDMGSYHLTIANPSERIYRIGCVKEDNRVSLDELKLVYRTWKELNV